MTIKGSLQVSIAIVKAFISRFWSNIWLGHVTLQILGTPPYLDRERLEL